MKLREGNVFSRRCLSACLSMGEGSHVTITHNALAIIVQGPPLALTLPGHEISLYRAPSSRPIPAPGHV